MIHSKNTKTIDLCSITKLTKVNFQQKLGNVTLKCISIKF